MANEAQSGVSLIPSALLEILKIWRTGKMSENSNSKN